ncbi:MAG: hypothetical protein ACFB22_14720 [Rhodothalassiaceae bacterium]
MRLRFLPLLLLFALLLGCGVNRNPLEVRVQRCPAPAILSGTDQLVRYLGAGRTANDVVFVASISDVRLDCDQGEDVVSDVSFDLTVRAGPALTEPLQITLPFFVTLLRDNSQIIAKQVYETSFILSPDQPFAGSRETVRQRFGSIEQPRRYDYELLVGLQLRLDDAVANLAE